VLTNLVSITIGGSVQEEFQNRISVVEFSKSTGDYGRGEGFFGEGTEEPVDSVEDRLIDLGSFLLLLDEFVSSGNGASVATHGVSKRW